MQTSLVTNVSNSPEVFVEPSRHNHPTNAYKEIRDATLSTIRKVIQKDPTKGLNATYKSVVATNVTVSNITDETRSLVPDYDSLRTVLQRERAATMPKLPKTTADIILEGEWAQTLDGDTFVLPNINNDMLIFTTNSNLQFLSRCSTIYVDGTFKARPTLFAQLYSIHGLFGGFVVPVVYALLPDKSSTTYYVMFGRIRDAMSRLKYVFNPASIMSDFEASLIEAVQLQFPNARHLGCHFHFGQALWRKIQEVGLAVNYREVDDIRSFVQHCNALAFIPSIEVVTKFEEAVGSLSPENRTQLAEFIEYFRATWLDGLFPINMWNKYGCDIRHRTNNAMEGWHSSLRRLLPTHPNIFVFIGAIKQIQVGAQVTMAKALAGQSPPKSKLKYRKLDEKVLKAHNRHENGDIDTDQLLRTVKHCFNATK